MTKVLFLLFMLINLIFARDNPFLPSGYKKDTKSSKLVKEEFKFPQNTKKIRRIIFEYINEDGTSSLKSVHIDKDFNPSNKIIIMQGDTSLTIPNLVNSINENNKGDETILDSNYVAKHFVNVYENDKEEKKIIKQKDKAENPKEDLDKKSENETTQDAVVEDSVLIKKIAFYNQITIDLYQDKFIILNSNDKLKIAFDIIKENKIVIDFNKKLDKKTEVQKINKDRYKDVIVGIHADFYRVVVRLDRLNSYKTKQINGGYEVSFK